MLKSSMRNMNELSRHVSQCVSMPKLLNMWSSFLGGRPIRQHSVGRFLKQPINYLASVNSYLL